VRGRLPSGSGTRHAPARRRPPASAPTPISRAWLRVLAVGGKHLREAALWEAARVEWEGSRETAPEI